ncbi:unnamed protein product, partial [Mesorhabditis spiculigera]
MGALTAGTPPSTHRPPRTSGYDLDSLLAVAVKVFNDARPTAPHEVLAKKLSITKSSIYYHVSGKSELLELALSRHSTPCLRSRPKKAPPPVRTSTGSNTWSGAA